MNEDKSCLDKDNNSKCCFFKVANAFLLLANLLLIILGFYYLNSKDDNSYFSMIVTVLAILVTVLLGWQIWKSVEFDKAIKRTNDFEYIANGYLEFSIGMSFIDTHPDRALRQCVFALERLNQASKADYDNIFMVLETLADSNPKWPLLKSDKARLVRAIKNSGQYNAEELIKKFENWPTEED